MECGVKVSGFISESRRIYYKDGVTYRDTKTGWVKVAGVWRQFFGRFLPYTDFIAAATSPTNANTVGSLPIPLNARNAVITLVANGGVSGYAGLGGGGGGAAVHSIALTAADFGPSISYSLRNMSQASETYGADTTASCPFTNGTMSLVSHAGRAAYSSAYPNGQGGSASGGNVSNTPGTNGTSTKGGYSGASDPGGDIGVAGSYGGGGGPIDPFFGTSNNGGQAYMKVDWS